MTAPVPVPSPLIVICAWCQRILTYGVGPASHGICAACSAAFDPRD